MSYGSKWHLLRFLGYHRQHLDREIGKVIGGVVVDWHDFGWNPGCWLGLDMEWKQLDFLADDNQARRDWPRFWPQTGNTLRWDAVGWVRVGAQIEILLIDAKAHVDELQSKCQAKHHGGLTKIEGALSLTKKALGVDPNLNWRQPYFQYCNRLAALHHLTEHGIGARLLFIYFCGDRHPGYICPQNTAGWDPHLQKQKAHLGLSGTSPLERRVHELFLPVR